MMSMGIVISNIGDITCSLSRPTRVLMVDGDDDVLGTANTPSQAPSVLNLPPAAAPTDGDRQPPPGSAYIWLVWVWREASTCLRLDPPSVEMRIEIPDLQVLTVPAAVGLAPCRGGMTIAGFGINGGLDDS